MQTYDFTSFIKNELPRVAITEDLTVTVNNRKNTVLGIQALAKSYQAKNKGEDTEFIDKALIMLLGEKNAKAIEELNLPFPEYEKMYDGIMLVAQGRYEEGVTPSDK